MKNIKKELQPNPNAFLLQSFPLEKVVRQGWINMGVPLEPAKIENVQQHTDKAIIICRRFLKGELAQKVTEILRYHDLAESIIGDLTPEDNVTSTEKISKEDQAMKVILTTLENEAKRFLAFSNLDVFREYIMFIKKLASINHEYEKRESLASKVAKIIDIIQMWEQALDYLNTFESGCEGIISIYKSEKQRNLVLNFFDDKIFLDKDIISSKQKEQLANLIQYGEITLRKIGGKLKERN